MKILRITQCSDSLYNMFTADPDEDNGNCPFCDEAGPGYKNKLYCHKHERVMPFGKIPKWCKLEEANPSGRRN